ncbi:MAG TPA: VWA domain-containing protein [Pyrinomonadaceae bacterium]|jgi:VWFA-related protein
MKRKFSSSLGLILVFALLAAPLSAQQTPTTTTATMPPVAAAPSQDTAPQNATPEDEVVRITSNLVQVDAVVLDKEGRQVTDLQAEDFEVLEDGKPQPITNFSYISTQLLRSPSPSASPSVASAVATKNVPPPPPALLRRAQVRRTIALVIDDLGLSFESTSQVRRSLKKFVDEQMQPGDMAAIIRTSAGVGALQQFTFDKQMLHAAIERVRWYPMGNGGPSPFLHIETDPATSSLRNDDGAGGRVAAVAGRLGDMDARQASERSEFREELFSVGTLGALNYIVRGLRELPGRKSVVLFSDGIRLFNRVQSGNREQVASDGTNLNNNNAGIKGEAPSGVIQNNRVVEALQRLTDLATRSSVVIYTIDARGLQSLALKAEDNVSALSTSGLQEQLAGRRGEFYETQEGLIYLARLTGGFAAQNSNDLNKAIARILDEQKGYYLIGYRPGEATFDPARGRSKFHDLTVRVKRPGLTVKTRLGFFGIPEESARPLRRTTEEQLAAALSSPFSSGNLNLRLTALFSNAPQTGSVVRSVLHIDARKLTFTPDAANPGWQKTTLDIIAFTYGDNGQVVQQVSHRDSVSVRNETLQSVMDNGIVYGLDVPVKKAGAYQLRIAVRDSASERIGSVNQLVEVPDLDKNRLALSGIYLSGRRLKKTVVASPKGTAAATSSPATASSSNVASFVPTDMEEEAEPDPQAVPAVRRFRHGMMLSYVYVIHNAYLERATGRPQLQTQMRLFRDGQMVYSGKVAPFNAEQQTDMKRIFAGGRLHLGTNLPAGEYILQVIVNDPLAPEGRRTATQWMTFEIVQ